MNENGSKWLIGILIVIVILLLNEKSNLEKEVIYWQDEYESVQSELNITRDNLEQANWNIEDARSYAWESYEDMGTTLDNLETVE